MSTKKLKLFQKSCVSTKKVQNYLKNTNTYQPKNAKTTLELSTNERRRTSERQWIVHQQNGNFHQKYIIISTKKSKILTCDSIELKANKNTARIHYK